MSIFCKHHWKIVKDSREMSSMARFLKGAKEWSNVSEYSLQDVHILVLQCEKCGKLDKTIERI